MFDSHGESSMNSKRSTQRDSTSLSPKKLHTQGCHFQFTKRCSQTRLDSEFSFTQIQNNHRGWAPQYVRACAWDRKLFKWELRVRPVWWTHMTQRHPKGKEKTSWMRTFWLHPRRFWSDLATAFSLWLGCRTTTIYIFKSWRTPILDFFENCKIRVLHVLSI